MSFLSHSGTVINTLSRVVTFKKKQFGCVHGVEECDEAYDVQPLGII